MTYFKEVKTPQEAEGSKTTVFDWWQVTVPFIPEDEAKLNRETGEIYRPEEDLVFWLADKLGFCDVVYGGGRYGYEASATINRGDSMLCQVLYGGVNGDPNVRASGAMSTEVRKLIARKYPAGKASRVDSAYDSYSGTSEFERITEWAEDRASHLGINCTWIKNSKKEKGDTLYIGSRTSRVQVRIYEKGKQMSFKPDDWWRAEVQLRPDSKAKKAVYNWSSGMVWTASRFTRELAEKLGGEALHATGFQQPPQKDFDTTLGHMISQYGNVLRELIRVEGSVWGAISRLDSMAEQMGKPRFTPFEAGERG